MPDLTTDPAAHTPEYLREVGQMLAEAVRVLNHATHPGNGQPGLRYPSDVYDLVGSLAEAMRRMPQLLDQLGDYLRREASAGNLADTSHPDPDIWARVIARDLNACGRLAESLAGELDRRHEDLSSLYVKEDPDA